MGRCSEGAHFRLRGVTVEHATLRALDNVDLEVRSGEAVALVGPSGAGKTTLLSLLNGSVTPAAGSVEVDGRDLRSLAVAKLACLRSCLGAVHQDLRLVANLRVVTNVLLGRLGRLSFLASLRLLLWPPRAWLLEAHSLLERVGIPEKLFERTDRLSGGQRQRVAIARALFQEPSALLADEPVSSVDPARARDTVELLVALCRERGLTLVVSLHDVELARAHFSRLIGLRHGRVIFDRPASEIAEADLSALYDLAPEELLSDAG